MRKTQGPTELQLDDIQGIIRRGYGALEWSHNIMLKISHERAARRWLEELVVRDGLASPAPGQTCTNIAFTYPGLVALGIKEYVADGKAFSSEFEEGMTLRHRSQILGDHGDSHPMEWEWGGVESEPVHILLMLFADTEELLRTHLDTARSRWQEAKLSEVAQIDGFKLPGRKEHFGFRDGISQPQIAGLIDKIEDEDEMKRSVDVLERGGSNGNIVAAGEFILGYRNVYGKMPATPVVTGESDTSRILPKFGGSEDQRDFGRNGSYLVFRQLSQDVRGFWGCVRDVTNSESEADRLAAKMVGRWRGGAPLVLSPEADDPELKDAHDFSYFNDDLAGDKCPVASHVRRTNPRDSKNAESNNPKAALADANKHRIVRRGRPYGQPLAATMEPADMLASTTPSGEQGLAFMCFNTNIGRQFEFIQHTWINNPKFDGLYASADPILGDANPKDIKRGIFGDFVEPGTPVRTRRSGLKRFVEVKGGGYFFMPGLRAIKYLARLE